MKTTDNTTVTPSDIETPELDGFAKAWLEATIIGLLDAKEKLTAPEYQHKNIQDFVTLLEKRIQKIQEEPNTLDIMDAVKASNTALRGAQNSDPELLKEASSILQ